MTTRVGALCVENIISFYLHAGSIGRFPTLKSLVSYIKCYYKAKDSKMVIVLQWLYNFHENVGGLLGGGGGGGGGGGKAYVAYPLPKLLGGTGPPPPPSPLLSPLLTMPIQKAAYLCQSFWSTENPYRTDRQKVIHR